jgi:hypothetical protein
MTLHNGVSPLYFFLHPSFPVYQFVRTGHRDVLGIARSEPCHSSNNKV